MRKVKEGWAVVLAGGEGTRLRQITTTAAGIVIPKQYCSVLGTSCLLQDALGRARSVVLPSHVSTVVAAQHREWWTAAIADVSETNVYVQPQNKGTAFGILLALLTLERVNPDATVFLLPADHYFRDEPAVTRALRTAGNMADANPSCLYLLGADPETPDPELGYILPAERLVNKASPIVGFKEKPARDFECKPAGYKSSACRIAVGPIWERRNSLRRRYAASPRARVCHAHRKPGTLPSSST